MLFELFTPTGTQSDFTKPPVNVAAVAGTFVRLDCTVENAQTVVWYEHITKPTEELITLNDEVKGDTAIYNISNPSTGAYNLGINLQGGEEVDGGGGRYRCQRLSPDTIEANLHVIVLGKYAEFDVNILSDIDSLFW